MRRTFLSVVLLGTLVLVAASNAVWGWWGAPGNLGNVMNSASFDAHPFVSPDGLWLYFGSERPGGQGDRDLWVSRRIGWSSSGPIWSPPRNMDPPLNSVSYDGHPCISYDGEQLLFASDRSGGLGNTDIWLSEWTGSEWGEPFNIGAPVNSSEWELSPFLAADGQTLYFCSSRPGGYGHQDMYRSTRIGNEWTNPENLGPSVNTDQAEHFPRLNSDMNVMYFQSWGHGGYGAGDLYRSFWTGYTWLPALNLGPSINTEFGDSGPFLFADMFTLYFNSNRPGGVGDTDLYVSTYLPDQWHEPINLGPGFNTPYLDAQPSISLDGTTLSFASERPGGAGYRDIWFSKLIGWSAQGPVWAPPKNPGTPVNSGSFDTDPFVNADGRLLYFASERTGGIGGVDIWFSQWTDGIGWGEPTHLDHPINSAYWDRDPNVSPDGKTLYFSSTRPGGYGDYDLYRSTWTGSGWSDPENLGPTINTWQQEAFCWINPEQTILYFHSRGHDTYGVGDLFSSYWTGSEWSEPTNLGPSVNTEAGEASPSVSGNMEMLYFHSNREGGFGDCNVYVSFAADLSELYRPPLLMPVDSDGEGRRPFVLSESK